MEKLEYTTIEKSFQYEIPKIKGSRFFATLIPVQTREEIDEKLEKVRKTYFDATHNCYAWRLWVDANQDLFWNWVISAHQERANDDWEPSNTAWKPILSVLTWKDVHNILCVITRYFWGTLLWVWWLIQAYTECSKQALENVPFVTREITKRLHLCYTYDQVSGVQYCYSKFWAKVVSDHYDNSIEQDIEVNIALVDAFLKEMVERQIQCKLID